MPTSKSKLLATNETLEISRLKKRLETYKTRVQLLKLENQHSLKVREEQEQLLEENELDLETARIEKENYEKTLRAYYLVKSKLEKDLGNLRVLFQMKHEENSKLSDEIWKLKEKENRRKFNRRVQFSICFIVSFIFFSIRELTKN